MTTENDKPPVDPFDPSQFAANSVVQGNVGVEKVMVTCPVRKPTKQEFIRVHPDPEYCLMAYIIELKEEGETYLLTHSLAAALPGESRTVQLRLTANRQGAIFVWPVPTPPIDGRDTDWGVSARAGAARSEESWVRLVANKAQNAYDVFEAPGNLGTPVWPNKSMRDILAIAFGEKYVIRDASHPVIRRLTGYM